MSVSERHARWKAALATAEVALREADAIARRHNHQIDKMRNGWPEELQDDDRSPYWLNESSYVEDMSEVLDSLREIATTATDQWQTARKFERATASMRKMIR